MKRAKISKRIVVLSLFVFALSAFGPFDWGYCQTINKVILTDEMKSEISKRLDISPAEFHTLTSHLGHVSPDCMVGNTNTRLIPRVFVVGDAKVRIDPSGRIMIER